MILPNHLLQSAARAILDAATPHAPPVPPPPLQKIKPPAVSKARTLGELLTNPELLRVPGVVIPFLVVEGRISLLSGREKSGKSTLVAHCLAAASRGNPVLGTAIPRPVKTLWYAIDEPLSDAVRRFAGLRADGSAIILNDTPRTLDELLNALILDLEQHPDVSLVVIDTLSKLIAMAGIDSSSSYELEPFMIRLCERLRAHGVAAILLYHTSKSGKEFRGSTCIGATVDEVLTLRRRGKSEEQEDFDAEPDAADGRRKLVRDGRNLRGDVQLDFVNGVYQLYADTTSPRSNLLNTLRDEGSVSGRSALCRAAGVRKQVGLQLIAALVAEGAITEHGSVLKIGRFGVTELQHTRTADGTRLAERQVVGHYVQPPDGRRDKSRQAAAAAGQFYAGGAEVIL